MSCFIRAAALVRDGDFSPVRERSRLQPGEWSALPCIVGSSSYAIGRVEADAEPLLAPPIELARELASGFGAAGPVLATASACTSGFSALQLALDLMQAGDWRHALVLGVELPNRLSAAGFASLGLGLRLGSAIGALVVSGEGPWRIAALAWRTEPSNLIGIASGTMKAAMQDALSRSGWRPADVDLVKLQAESDPAERQALASLFPSIPKTISLRGRIGHTLGASGPAELALLLGEPRPERRILFNLSGFGGQMACLALERAA
ncbi:MAG TPA: beta-ketoacyl synthase N-terminal-like domain-containing protein [Burkholderiales bacterium]|nr:beta-ketoacyl synthase N-terminal-like domain-containing protein [Burkholderiales bacterium]